MEQQPHNWSRSEAKSIVREVFSKGRITEKERDAMYAVISDMPPDSSDTPRALQGLLRGEVFGAVESQNNTKDVPKLELEGVRSELLTTLDQKLLTTLDQKFAEFRLESGRSLPVTGTYTQFYHAVQAEGRLKPLTPRLSQAAPDYIPPEEWKLPQRAGKENVEYLQKLKSQLQGLAGKTSEKEHYFGKRKRSAPDGAQPKVWTHELDPGLVIIDTHGKYYLDGLSPDITIMDKNMDYQQLNLCAVSFIELQVWGLDSEHRGKCLAYVQKILELQSWRTHAEGFLTDTDNLEFFRGIRQSNGQITFEFKANMHLSDPDAAQFLQSRLTGPAEALGFMEYYFEVDGVLRLRPKALLGKSRSSVYVTDHLGKECALKVTGTETAEDKAAGDREDHALRSLKQSSSNVALLPRLQKSFIADIPNSTQGDVKSARVFLTYPVVQPMEVPSAQLITDHIAGLELLHKSGVVHMDIEPHHLCFYLEGGKKRGSIIDLSCCLPISVSIPVEQTSGSSRCAATSLLKTASETSVIKPTKQHDIEAYVKALYLLIFPEIREKLAKTSTEADSRRACIRAWELQEPVLKGTLWSEALEAARFKQPYRKVESILKRMFPDVR